MEISRGFLAFEEDFSTANGSTRYWVTLLPLSSSGAWVDYVYAFVSVETAPAADAGEVPPEGAQAEEVRVDETDEVEDMTKVAADEVEAAADAAPAEAEQPGDVSQEAGEPDEPVQAIDEQEPAEPADVAAARPGFAKLIEGFAGLTGFYDQSAKVEPVMPLLEPIPTEQPAIEQLANESEAFEPPATEEPVNEQPANEPAEEPASTSEGPLQSKLADVRAKADEARAAKVQANTMLYEGLGAAYDFALDAEDSPEEYLRLVEAEGLKIQLRSPMAPVAKLAFDGMCDDSIMAQLEAVLAWALKQELPRGSLAARINEAGGITGILSEESRPS